LKSVVGVARAVGLAVAIALCAPVPVIAQGAGTRYVEPANLHDLVAAAAKEGVLNLAVGASFGGPEGARIIQERLDKRYHINLVIHYSPIVSGVPFVQQLFQEVKAGQTASSDIAFTMPSGAGVPYVERIDWRKYLPKLPEEAMVYDKHAVTVLSTLHSFSYNTKLIPPNQVPRSFADLLKPQWKGKIATSSYQGTFLNYIGLPEVFGHQGMLDYVHKFAGQIGGLMVCGNTDRVVSGEFLIFGIDCGDHEVRKRQRLGQPIASIYPREGTLLSGVNPAIPKTAAHPNAARLFIVFLLTREGQDVLWDVTAEDNAELPGSHMAAIIADARRHGVKIIQGVALDATHPELAQYAREIDDILTAGR
jgi:ABC-type Fe3+ transport system substrate-binding protein